MAWIHRLFAWYPMSAGRLLRLGLLTAGALVTLPLAAPAYAASASWTPFPLPTPSAFPGSIVAGPAADGTLWFAESGKIGRISTAGALREFALPAGHNPRSIALGPDGKLWFTEPGNGIVGSVTTSGAITEYLLPGNRGYGTPINQPQQIVAGPDGQMWFTQTIFSRQLVRVVGGQIDSVDASGAISTRATLTSSSTKATTAVPDAIVLGPDRAVWFADTRKALIERVTGNTASTVYQLSAGSPVAMAFAPDGSLWLTASFGGASGSLVDQVSAAGTLLKQITVKPDSATNGNSVGAIALGSDGNMWFTNYDMFSSLGSIWRVNRAAPQLTRFSFPESQEVDGLVNGPDSKLWFTTTNDYSGQSSIGRLA